MVNFLYTVVCYELDCMASQCIVMMLEYTIQISNSIGRVYIVETKRLQRLYYLMNFISLVIFMIGFSSHNFGVMYTSHPTYLSFSILHKP